MTPQPKWQMMRDERGTRSKDLIKTRHGMSYCDSRDQDRGVCVCSLQLWIISTLFLLWPTCAERRMCPHESLFLFYFHCDSARGGLGGRSPYGKPYVNMKLSISAGDNQSHRRHPRCMFPPNVQPVWCCTAESLRRCIRRLLKVYRQFSPPLRLFPMT